MKKLIASAMLLSLSLTAAAVEKRYVSDTLHLDLRSGPSNEYRIITYIASGEHLVLLEDESLTDDRYAKVRTNKDIEGYVLTRFLQDEPIAKEKLIFANREIENLKKELDTTKKQRDELRGDAKKLQAESSDLSSTNSQLEKELEHIKSISASALKLDKENKELTSKNQELEIQLQALTTENSQLNDTRQQTYILYGGGLVFAGILAGLILPSLRGKRSSGWA